MKRAIPMIGAVLGITALYYLCGVFITGDFNPSEWDSLNKFFTVLFFWLPACVVALYLIARHQSRYRID